MTHKIIHGEGEGEYWEFIVVLQFQPQSDESSNHLFPNTSKPFCRCTFLESKVKCGCFSSLFSCDLSRSLETKDSGDNLPKSSGKKKRIGNCDYDSFILIHDYAFTSTVHLSCGRGSKEMCFAA